MWRVLPQDDYDDDDETERQLQVEEEEKREAEDSCSPLRSPPKAPRRGSERRRNSEQPRPNNEEKENSSDGEREIAPLRVAEPRARSVSRPGTAAASPARTIFLDAAATTAEASSDATSRDASPSASPPSKLPGMASHGRRKLEVHLPHLLQHNQAKRQQAILERVDAKRPNKRNRSVELSLSKPSTSESEVSAQQSPKSPDTNGEEGGQVGFPVG